MGYELPLLATPFWVISESGMIIEGWRWVRQVGLTYIEDPGFLGPNYWWSAIAPPRPAVVKYVRLLVAVQRFT